MKTTILIVRALVIAAVGVFVIDYFSHLLFSTPMETTGYFVAKAVVYFLYSLVFLAVVNTRRHEFWKVAIGGVIVALLWGGYYNVLPLIISYVPFGIPLRGLSFLGMGYYGTGLAFGIVHTLAFVGGYYVARILKAFSR